MVERIVKTLMVLDIVCLVLLGIILGQEPNSFDVSTWWNIGVVAVKWVFVFSFILMTIIFTYDVIRGLSKSHETIKEISNSVNNLSKRG